MPSSSPVSLLCRHFLCFAFQFIANKCFRLLGFFGAADEKNSYLAHRNGISPKAPRKPPIIGSVRVCEENLCRPMIGAAEEKKERKASRGKRNEIVCNEAGDP